MGKCFSHAAVCLVNTGLRAQDGEPTLPRSAGPQPGQLTTREGKGQSGCRAPPGRAPGCPDGTQADLPSVITLGAPCLLGDPASLQSPAPLEAQPEPQGFAGEGASSLQAELASPASTRPFPTPAAHYNWTPALSRPLQAPPGPRAKTQAKSKEGRLVPITGKLFLFSIVMSYSNVWLPEKRAGA